MGNLTSKYITPLISGESIWKPNPRKRRYSENETEDKVDKVPVKRWVKFETKIW